MFIFSIKGRIRPGPEIYHRISWLAFFSFFITVKSFLYVGLPQFIIKALPLQVSP